MPNSPAPTPAAEEPEGQQKLLWAAIVLAVLVLGGLTLRAARQDGRGGSSEGVA